MSSGCSSEELEKLKKKKRKKHLILKGLGLQSWKNDPKTLLIKWSKNFTQKVIPKIRPQLLLKDWSWQVTQKLAHNSYSKTGPQLFIKSDPQTLLTQKLTHKRCSKTDLQTLLKKWSTNLTRLLSYLFEFKIFLLHKQYHFMVQILFKSL